MPAASPHPAGKLTPSSFAYGCLLGEGAYGRVIHARLLLPNGKLGPSEYAVKMIEKRVIQREKKVRFNAAAIFLQHAQQRAKHLPPLSLRPPPACSRTAS